jgi:RNA polymerase sigma factor (sigma-70 family)
MEKQLTQAVLEYQQYKTGYKDLIYRIAQSIYRYPEKIYHWDEDTCSDFFAYFYPKIPDIINRFIYYGKPFEAYLYTSAKWQMKSFLIKKKQMRIRENFIVTEEIQKYSLCSEPEHEYITPTLTARKLLNVDNDNVITRESNKKRLLFLMFKEIMNMDDSKIRGIALITGYNINCIHFCALQLREKVQQRINRFELLRERRNKCFFNIRILQEEAACAFNSEQEAFLLAKLFKARKRLYIIIKELSHVSRQPTHKEIADLLQIPKGTVDSGLYYFKERFKAS